MIVFTLSCSPNAESPSAFSQKASFNLFMLSAGRDSLAEDFWEPPQAVWNVLLFVCLQRCWSAWCFVNMQHKQSPPVSTWGLNHFVYQTEMEQKLRPLDSNQYMPVSRWSAPSESCHPHSLADWTSGVITPVCECHRCVPSNPFTKAVLKSQYFDIT